MTYNSTTSISLPRLAFVDDDPRVLSGLTWAMRKMADQWEMHFFESGKDALEISKERPFDVMVTDLRMPEMTGLQLVRAVNDLYPQTQCMVLTASDDIEDAMGAINDVSVFRFYVKPRPANDLIQGVKDALAYASWNTGGEDAKNIEKLSDLGFATLDTAPVPTIMLTRDCKVVFMNKLGSNLLANKNVLILGSDQVCRGLFANATMQLHDAVKALSDDEFEEHTETLLVLPRYEGVEDTRPLVISLYKLSTGEGNDEKLVAMFLANPSENGKVPDKMLQQLFDLTGSEAKLVGHLVDGASLADTADSMGLTVNTARTYLKRIFSKTCTSRQAELVRVVLTSVSSSHI